MAKTSTPQKTESTPRSFVDNLESNIVDKGGVTTCNNQNTNINHEIDECITSGINTKGQVCTGCNKFELEQEGANHLVPSSQSLFEPIYNLV